MKYHKHKIILLAPVKYATRNATQNKINAFVMRIYKVLKRVRLPLSAPKRKIGKSRIVAANGFTIRDFLILFVPNCVSMSCKNMNACCILDEYATRNATRNSINNGHLFANFFGIFFHCRGENMLIHFLNHISRAMPHKFGNVFLRNSQKQTL